MTIRRAEASQSDPRPGYGSGFSSTALTTLNTAVLAPMPSAMMAMASTAKPGLRRNAVRHSGGRRRTRRPGLPLRRSRHSSLLLSIGAHRAQRGVSRLLRRQTGLQAFARSDVPGGTGSLRRARPPRAFGGRGNEVRREGLLSQRVISYLRYRLDRADDARKSQPTTAPSWPLPRRRLCVRRA